MVNIYQIYSGELLTAWKIGNVENGILVGESTGVNGTIVTTGSLAAFSWEPVGWANAGSIGKLIGAVSEHLHQQDFRDPEAVFASRRGRELTGGTCVVRIR